MKQWHDDGMLLFQLRADNLNLNYINVNSKTQNNIKFSACFHNMETFISLLWDILHLWTIRVLLLRLETCFVYK